VTSCALTTFQELCKRLENMDKHRTDKLKIRRDANGHAKIQCFIKDFEDYFQVRKTHLLRIMQSYKTYSV